MFLRHLKIELKKTHVTSTPLCFSAFSNGPVYARNTYSILDLRSLPCRGSWWAAEHNTRELLLSLVLLTRRLHHLLPFWVQL